MAFDVNAALKDGHSEAAIADYLGRQNKFDVATARKDGYSDKDILGFLNKPKEPEVTKPAGFSAKETAASLGQGIIGAGKSLTDVFGADNAASKFLGEQNRALEGAYSPERKAEMAQRQAKITEAEKSGSLTKEIGAYLGTIADAPVQSLAQGLGSIVPYIGTGVIGGLAKLGGAAIKALNTVVGAAQGAGTIKGSVYDAVKDELEKGGMKPSEAAEKASKAQEYLGPNALQIMAGTALGGVAARFGVENLLQKGAADKLSAKLIPRVLTAAGAEAPLEGLQGGQEQAAKNLALQEAGFDVPTMQGVFGSAFRDAALGALTAGAVGAVRGPDAKPIEEPITPTGNPPTNSPVASTTTINISGKESTKTTRADGSVEIDGVQVAPPTTTADATEDTTTKDTTKEEPEKTTTGYKSKFNKEGYLIEQPLVENAEDLLPDGVALSSKVAPEIQNIQDYVDSNKSKIADGTLKGFSLEPTKLKVARLEEALGLINEGKTEEALLKLTSNDIKSLKLEGLLNVKPINTTAVGTSTQTSGEPRADAPAAGTPITDQGGVAFTNNVLKGAEAGEGDKSTALTEEEAFKQKRLETIKKIQDPIKSFFTWAPNLPEDAETSDFPNLVKQWGLETNQPQEIIDELSGAEVKPVEETTIEAKPVEETTTEAKPVEETTTEVINKEQLEEDTNKTLEDELEDQAEAYFAEETDEEADTRLAAAPRTVSAENQQRQVKAQQRDVILDEIKADTTRTKEQKQTEIHMQSYLVAAGNNIRKALDFLAADMFSGEAYNANKNAPFTGGKAAKAFYESLSKNDKKAVDNKIDFLEKQYKRVEKYSSTANEKAKQETKDYDESILEDLDEIEPDKNKEGQKLNIDTELYGGTTPRFMAAILRGDLRGALQEIVNDKTGQFTQLDKLIANRLLKSNSLPAVNVVRKLDRGYGNYNTGTDVITIREDAINSHVVLHEALHGFTASLVIAWQNKNVVNGNIDRINDLYEFLKANHPEIVNQYAFSDLVEFISEAFSNTNFQKQLSAIPYKKGVENVKGLESLGTAFVKLVLKLLGISPNQKYTALAEALIATDAIMTSGRKFQGTAEGVKKVLNLKAEREPRTRASYEMPEKQKPKNLKYFQDLFFTPTGRARIVNRIQNSRIFAKNVSNEAERAGLLKYNDENMNNFYDWITLGAGRAKTFYNRYVEEPYNKLNGAVAKLAKEQGVDTEEILMDLHEYFEAKHEPERRMVKYIMTVPLTKEANAEREAILNELRTNIKLTEQQAKEYRQLLDAIVSKNFDAYGFSPPNVNLKKPTDAKQVTALQDPNSSYYNVVGLTPQEVQAKIDKFGNMNYLKEITSAMKELHEATITMNQKSNYWSKPVNNLKNFYGFENYVPLKGLNVASETDENLDFTSERLSGELVKSEESFEGRVSVSNNPVLQTLADSVQAAMRAGRGVETTLSIKNAIKDGIIQGSVNKQKGQNGEPISFLERTTSDILKQLKEDKGNKFILHYNSDGSIDILQIDSKRILESIRRTYSKQNTLVDVANSFTSTLGKMHTRYNYNFAPLNFVRDALTNAFNIGAKIGPFKSAQFLGKLAVDLATNGSMNKAFNVARLYAQPNGLEKIKALAAKTKDPIYQNMADYIDQGGMVEYLQGMSIKSNFDELNKKVGRSGIITKVEDFNKMIDIWNNMFEIASRSSAFGMMKNYYMNTQKLAEKEANTKAAAFVKNLANFEQVGTHGKELGAMFMFFRPSATGAVRAIDAISPIFADVDRARNRLPNNGAFAFEMVEGKRVYKNPKAIATWEKNYAFERKSAGYMAASLMGMGALLYTMSLMMAPDDELGRNKTNTDNMDQWNRFVRFHFPGTDKVFQIPWGFGLGAFAAAGAQLAAVANGNGTMGDAMRNIFTQISLDSFVPIPVSRMKFSDNPAMWAVDSVLPSFMRPAVEFTVNINGIGQNIYNDSNRRMGDAYLGGDNIPQVYKDIAEHLAEKTLGYIDWSPNSIYFLTNSYMDGFAKVLLELPTSLYDTASGRKEFTPKSVPFIGSFISSESSVDAREFAEYEKDIKETRRILEGFDKRSPESAIEYRFRNPLAESLVDAYEDGTKDLNKLRAEANDIRNLPISPAEITSLLKVNKLEQNLFKNELVETFKMYNDIGKD